MLGTINPALLAGKQAHLLADPCGEADTLASGFRAAGCIVREQVFGGAMESGPTEAADILVIFPRPRRRGGTQDGGDAWRDEVEAPLREAYLCCRRFSGAMARRGWGRILLIGAVQAKTGGWNTGGSVGFCTLAASLAGLARAMAVELAPHGVTVNAILPLLDMDDRDHILETVPLDRLPGGADVAGAALFLASEEAAFITGYSLDINSGLFMD